MRYGKRKRTPNTIDPEQVITEPSRAREWRWPEDFEIKIDARRPVMRVVRIQSLLDNSAMENSFASIRQSLLQAMKAGLTSLMLSCLVAMAFMVTLPAPEAGASQQTQESYAEWKHSMYMPVAIVTIIHVPLIVALARFASAYPPQPVSFKYSLGVTAVAAALAHLMTTPLKGSPNHVAPLVGAIAAVTVLTLIGFRREEVAAGTGQP